MMRGSSDEVTVTVRALSYRIARAHLEARRVRAYCLLLLLAFSPPPPPPPALSPPLRPRAPRERLRLFLAAADLYLSSVEAGGLCVLRSSSNSSSSSSSQ